MGRAYGGRGCESVCGNHCKRRLRRWIGFGIIYSTFPIWRPLCAHYVFFPLLQTSKIQRTWGCNSEPYVSVITGITNLDSSPSVLIYLFSSSFCCASNYSAKRRLWFFSFFFLDRTHVDVLFLRRDPTGFVNLLEASSWFFTFSFFFISFTFSFFFFLFRYSWTFFKIRELFQN